MAAAWAPAAGQRLDTTLEKLARDAARSYVEPVVSGFGAALNSGWFHRTPPPAWFKPGFEAGLTGMGSLLTGAAKHFETQGHFTFDRNQTGVLIDSVFRAFSQDPRTGFLTPEQKQAVRDSLVSLIAALEFQVGISGATVVGDPLDSIRVAFPGTTVHLHIPTPQHPEGVDTTLVVPARQIALGIAGILSQQPILPLLAPQITVGTVIGTQATLRWLPPVVLNEKLGALGYFGFGVQHNPAVWLPFRMPLDLSAGFFTQRLTLGESFTAVTVAGGLTASRTIGFRFFNFTPYAGYMRESSTMTVEYDYTLKLPTGDLTRKIRFDLAGLNRSRYTLGASLRLLIFNLNADYNIGQYDSFSVGLMVGL